MEGIHPEFIDLQEQATKRVGGQEVIKPPLKSLNTHEKGNMCTWLCENGEIADCFSFKVAFQIIEEIIKG